MQEEMKEIAEKWISDEFRRAQERDPKNSWDALDEAARKVRIAFLVALDRAEDETKDMINRR